MNEQQNQVDEFFKNLPDEDKQTVDIFEAEKPTDVVAPKIDDVDPETVPSSIKDRRHRRLEAKLQAERESNIAMAAIIKDRSERERFIEEAGDSVNPEIARMFDGSETGKENALRLSRELQKIQQNAEEAAVRRIEERLSQEREELKKNESLIDNELESLEDSYNVDLTSDSPKARKARREFLELVEQLSPKDDNGDIVGYADFDAVFTQYQKTRTEEKPDNTRRQEIASRSMQRSTSNTEVVKQRTPGFHGWKADIERGNY